MTLASLHDEMLENVDAVESIILCAAHQGRIADGMFAKERSQAWSDRVLTRSRANPLQTF